MPTTTITAIGQRHIAFGDDEVSIYLSRDQGYMDVVPLRYGQTSTAQREALNWLGWNGWRVRDDIWHDEDMPNGCIRTWIERAA